jgi:vancomycin resistance protein YoaR
VRAIAFALGISLTAIIATIVFVACGTSNAQPTPVNTDGTIAAGVTVNGVDIGGLARDQAESKLNFELPDPSTGKLTIVIGPLTQDVTYASVSRAYDMNAIMQAAFASTGGEVAATTTYNADALAGQINTVVTTAQAEPINATITFENGQYVLTAAVDGRSIDGAALLANAGTLMANGNPADQTLDVPVTAVPADINSEAAQAAIDRAQAVTTLPLTITAGGSTFVVDAATLRTWVTLEQTTPGVWDLAVDDLAVTTYINTIKAQVDQAPVDAEWHFGDGAEPIVTPSETGYLVDALAAVQQVEAALAAAQPGVPIAPIALTVVTTEPDFTTAEAQAAAGKVSLLGAWTTHYIPSHFNGNGVNIRRPASMIDGTVIQSGDVFDFYKLTGPYTVANGYTDGAALIHGKTVGEGVLGGGLCSASTTMFNAALRAGFQMGARYNHAYYITRYPVGLDATIWVSGNSVKNMTFTNDSKYPIVVRAINKKRSVTFQIWGVSDGRTVNLSDPVVTGETEANQYWQFTDTLGPRQTERTEYGADGFDSVVNRTVRDASGNVIHTDSFRSDYRRTDGIVLVGRCGGDPPSTTKIPLEQSLPPCNGGPTPTPGGTPKPTPTGGETSPIAKFTKNCTSAGSCTFDASASTGGNLTYSWSYSDGGSDTGMTASHNFATSGTVTLTVSNTVGSNPKTKSVTVSGGGGPSPEPSNTPVPTSPTPSPSPTE